MENDPIAPEPAAPAEANDPLTAAIEAATRPRSSDLRAWLDAKFDRLMAAGGRITSWQALADLAANEGIRTANDAPPSAAKLSRLWHEIRRRRSGQVATRSARTGTPIESAGKALALVEARPEPDAASHSEPGTSLVSGRARFAEAMARQQQPHAIRPVTAKELAERAAAKPESKAVPDGEPGSLTAAMDDMRAAAIRRGPF